MQWSLTDLDVLLGRYGTLCVHRADRLGVGEPAGIRIVPTNDDLRLGVSHPLIPGGVRASGFGDIVDLHDGVMRASDALILTVAKVLTFRLII